MSTTKKPKKPTAKKTKKPVETPTEVVDETPPQEVPRPEPAPAVDSGLTHVDTIRPMLAELERYIVWVTEGIHNFEINLDGLDGKIVPTIQTRGRAKKLGHFAPERWTTKEGGIDHEISLTAEDLKRDPYEVLGTLHHELVHAAAHARGIKDMAAGGGQRHNRAFKDLAESFGLRFMVLDEEDEEPRPDKTYGWAFTELTDELRHEIEMSFQPNIEVFNLFRTLPPAPPPQPTKMKLWICDCRDEKGKPEYKIRTAKQIQATCDVCGSSFYKDETSTV